MQKLRGKALALVLCIVMLAAVFAGCGAVTLERPARQANAQTYPVTGSCEIAIDNGVITVSGETDIADGALLHVSVAAQDGMVIDSTVITKSGDQISENFQITDDKYDGVTLVKGYITCAPKRYGDQPDSIYQMYGEDFEDVDPPEGNYIWLQEGVIIMFASEFIDF